MSKWKDTSNHWSKTNKREEVLAKIVKNLQPHIENLTHDYWNGKKRSQITKDKISLTKTGNSPNCNKGGNAPWCKGEKNFNWKGGVVSEHQKIRNGLEYKDWANNVYKRDNWTCVICKTKTRKGNIVAHHTLSFSEYPEYRFELLNGITLCRSCHKKTHKDIGINTRFKS